MAARKKKAKKTPAKKKVGARKVSKAAAPARKKAAPRKKAAVKKPPSRAARKAPAAKPAPKPTAAESPAKKAAAPPAGTFATDAVLLSHVMALRPRVHVGFKPSAFADAKRSLADRRYATIEEATRAVVEKAIEISNEFSPGSPFGRR
jgi:hypothetical protein